jgi:hypothetical protein
MLKGASAEGRADPLKTRSRGSSRSTLPCFLILPENGFSGAGSYSQRRDTALLFPVSITLLGSQSIPLIRAIGTPSSV